MARQVKGRPDETEDLVQVYVPMTQAGLDDTFLLVRPATSDAAALAPAVRAAIGRIDTAQLVSVGTAKTLDDIAREATSSHRFRAVLVAAFAGLALVLAMVGVFGILAYSVQQRTADFAVRRAMGATTNDVLRLVAGSAARVVVAGAAIGLVLSMAVTRLLTTVLFGVEPLDPVTFAWVAVALATTASLAIAGPAWRATQIDPAVTLRSQMSAARTRRWPRRRSGASVGKDAAPSTPTEACADGRVSFAISVRRVAGGDSARVLKLRTDERGGSPGCDQSGRRWHRRIPAVVSRSAALVSVVALRRRGGRQPRARSPRWRSFRCDSLPTSDELSTTHAAHRRGPGQGWRRWPSPPQSPSRARRCRGVQSLQQVQTQPGRFVDHSVTVSGTVTTAWGVPFVGFNVYRLDDGTGEITVVSTDRRVPGKGARVEVRGKVRTWRSWAAGRWASPPRAARPIPLTFVEIQQVAAGPGRPPSQGGPARFSCTACPGGPGPGPARLVKSSTM